MPARAKSPSPAQATCVLCSSTVNAHSSTSTLACPLGLGASSYPEYKLKLEPGAKLLFYTDGITEATNRDEEEYGAVRLLEHFHQPDACIDGLLEEVQRFHQRSDRTDDATAVLIRSR